MIDDDSEGSNWWSVCSRGTREHGQVLQLILRGFGEGDKVPDEGVRGSMSGVPGSVGDPWGHW